MNNSKALEFFAAIIHHHQKLNATAVHLLVAELQKMKISQEAGEDVSKFCNKLTDKCRRITGTGHAPVDLATIVATTFISSNDEGFRISMRSVLDKTNSFNTKETWRTVIDAAKQKHQDLLAHNLYSPAQNKSEIMKLNAEVKKLQLQVIKQKRGE